MKKLLIVALAASSLTSVALPAPALATVATPIVDMEAVCANIQVNPNGNAGFVVKLDEAGIQSSVGTPVRTVLSVLQDIPGGQLISQTAPAFVAGSQGRNGQSPNIFGTFKSVLTFTGGTKVEEVQYTTPTTFTFQCVVYKVKRNGSLEPNGLQPDPSTIVRTESYVTTETVSKPDYTEDRFSESVICNSPTKNPGVWRAQNGYTGTCSTALFNSLSQITIHSNSLPALESLIVPGSNSPAPQNQDAEVQLIDLDQADDI